MKSAFIPSVFVALALTACAETKPATSTSTAISSATCAQVNWQAIGYEDGARGAPFAAYSQRAAACEAQGYKTNRLAYSTGRLQGLKTYCTVDNGYADGYARRENSGVCPPDLAAAYQRGYRQGVSEDNAPTVNWPSTGI